MKVRVRLSTILSLAVIGTLQCLGSEVVHDNVLDSQSKHILDPAWSQSGSKLGETTSLEQVIEEVKKTSTLEGLNLSQNLMSDKGIERLTETLKNVPLKWVDVSYNRITSRGFQNLVGLLQENSSISYINIFSNPASSMDTEPIFRSLAYDILERLVLVDENWLYHPNWELLIKGRGDYSPELVQNLRDKYQNFFDLKYQKPLEERIRSKYLKSLDQNGTLENFIGNDLAEMNRYREAQKWYLEATNKKNPHAPYNLALLFKKGFLKNNQEDPESSYLEYLQKAQELGNQKAVAALMERVGTHQVSLSEQD